MTDEMISEDASAAVAVIEVGLGMDRSVLILQRIEHPGDPWSGHLAFPGGRREVDDADILGTCLREAQEESGVELRFEDLVRPLRAGYAGRVANRMTLVQPFYFRLPSRPKIHLQKNEMQSYFWLPLAYFEDLSQHGEFEVSSGRVFPCIRLEGVPLWGFTYEVLRGLYLP